jgi:hypothetical protein
MSECREHGQITREALGKRSIAIAQCHTPSCPLLLCVRSSVSMSHWGCLQHTDQGL